MAHRMRSIDPSRFSMVPQTGVPRSAFDQWVTRKTTFDAGWLVPIYLDEVLPGDSHRVRMHGFARLATPLTPVMDNLYLETFFFFVPCRLLWNHWEEFMGQQEPGAVTEYLVPITSVPPTGSMALTQTALMSYFGINNQSVAAATVPVNALPLRAYNLIWNEWFRDQDLQASEPTNVDSDGPDNNGDYTLLRRNKRHDYFTTCRPWPGKPNALTGFGSSMMNPFAPGLGMNFPTGQNDVAWQAWGAGAPVTGIGVGAATTPTAGPGTVKQSGGRNSLYPNYFDSGTTSLFVEGGLTLGGAASNYPNVRVLINDIRTSSMVQWMMERDARGGTRYVEAILTRFGVRSPDFRLQRPELLGGGRSFVNVAPIAQTSATRANDPDQPGLLGEQAGIGTAVVQNHGFSQSFTEHGYIIGLLNVRADLSYQQGINRLWSRRSKWDFYDPALAHLGEQAVLSREIYADGSGNNTGQLGGSGPATGDYSVFGYQERWAEYRYMVNDVSGMFRSWSGAPLDQWHFAQDFDPRPLLTADFIQENPPIDRVLQVDGEDYHQFLFDGGFEVRRVRPMPMFSVPGMGSRL